LTYNDFTGRVKKHNTIKPGNYSILSSNRHISWTDFGPPILLVCLWIFLSIMTPHFSRLNNQINILRHASILLIVAAAQTIAVISGGLNLAVGASATLASVVAALAALSAGTFAGYAAGVLSGVITGIFLGFFVGFLSVNSIIATVGLLAIARGIAFELTKGQTVTGLPPDYSILGRGFIGAVPVPVIVSFSCIIIVHLFLKYTIWGRRIFSIGVDTEAARLSGINVRFYHLLAQTISVTLAAFAGVMLGSRVHSGMATLGETMGLESIAAVIIGGTHLFSGEGNVFRAGLGVLIITVLSNGMDLLHVSPYLRQILLGIIVISVVFFNTRGKNLEHAL
jgi:ribose transport system permease protein